MTPSRHALDDARGFTLIELLMATAIFIFIAFGMGSLYLSARDGFNYGSAEAFVQRQGTLVQEELTRQLQSATAIQIARCREVTPGSMLANKSVIYTLYFPGRAAGSQYEYWCVYEYQRAAFSPFSQLWRCPLTDASIDQACNGGSASAENLLPPVPASVAGQRAEVLNTSVTPAPVAGIATSVDISFDVNLHAQTSTASLLWSPRRFAFNVTIRN